MWDREAIFYRPSTQKRSYSEQGYKKTKTTTKYQYTKQNEAKDSKNTLENKKLRDC